MEILVILLLILLNGLFAMSEIALISARRSNLEMQARQGSAGARQALKLAKDPDRFLSTVQIGITLIGILTGIYSGDTLAAKFGGELARLGIPLRTATVTAQVTIVIAVTYLTIIFGELVPKRIGMNAAERAAKIVAQPMRLLSVAASPFVWLLSRSTAGVARLLGLQRAESKVTEAEIRSRYEIKLENYAKVLNIEAETCLMMAEKEILPACMKFAGATAKAVNAMKTAGVEPYAEAHVLADVAERNAKLYKALEGLRGAVKATCHGDALECAKYEHNVIIPAMAAVREQADELETLVGKEYWPFPTYDDLLFNV